jgi:tetratricopeptide (TPR) repeat protein
VYESQGTELGQGWTHFAGLIVPKDVAPAFKRMYRVEDLGGFGLLPVVTLPADLALVRRCQRVRTPDQALLDQISLFQRAVQDRLNPPQPGGSPDAIQRNRAALAQDPKNLGAAYGLGTALEARGDSPGALEAYRAAIAVAPDFRVFYRCINKLTAPPIDPEQRVRTWQDTVQQFPSAYRAHYYLGLALEAKHDLPAAAAAYRQALQLQPADYAVYGRLGMLLLQQQLASDRTSAAPDLDAAREVLRDGAMRNPDEPGALEYLDSFYVKTNDREGRVLEWDSFVAARPNLALAHYHLGVALDEDGEWTRAAEVLSRAAALDPRNSLILTRLAQTSLKNGDAKAVKRCWRALCHAGSDRVGLAVSLATAVRSLREQRQIDQAIAALLLVVSLEPRCSWAWSELGAALEEQGDRDGAARAYRIANNTAPK